MEDLVMAALGGDDAAVERLEAARSDGKRR